MPAFTIDSATALETRRHGIPYVMQRTPGAEVDTNYQENWTPDLVNSSFVAIVAWDDSDTFVLDMIGEHQQNAGYITRWNPEQSPFNSDLYCVGCKTIANLGRQSLDANNGNAVKFEYVAFAVTFASFIYPVLDDDQILIRGTPYEFLRYVERYTDQVGQSISTAGQFEYSKNAAGVFVPWVAPGGATPAIPTPPALMLPYRQIEYVWRYVPGPLDRLENQCDALYGQLNDAVFDGKAIGTCMYVGMKNRPVPSTPAGNRLFTVTHKVLYFLRGWNSVYRPNLGGGDGAWDVARNRATGEPPYSEVDFSFLWIL